MENIEKVMQILEKHYKYTERTTLNSMREEKDAFKILISCLISLRVKDEITEKISKELFKIVVKQQDIVDMPKEKLEKIIFSSGYYRNKAKTLKHVSSELINRFNSKVPESEEELLSIKGIGRKTMNIVRAFAFGKEAIPVDVNVHRIANRLGLVETKNADKTEKELEKILPKKYWREINALFILHGKKICVPVSPFCSLCPIQQYCKKIGVERVR